MSLLSTEIETLVTTQYPLETTREALVAILSNRDCNTTQGNFSNFSCMFLNPNNFFQFEFEFF
jgi:hypothetical protein